MHPWHDQGGWSQARFQRGIEKEVKDHVKHANDELFKLFKSGRRATADHRQPRGVARARSRSTLHSYLRERIAGWLDIDVNRPPDRGRARGAGIIERDERDRERHWLDRLQAGLARTSARCRGLADTLEALNEQRVEALLVADGFRAEGYASPQADFLSAEPGDSPTGEELQHRDDVIESAIERALEQSAEVVFVRHHPGHAGGGSIGAVLRY